MDTNKRFFAISAPSFNGTTDVPDTWQQGLNPDIGRMTQTSATPVGRFRFKNLARPGILGALVFARSWGNPAGYTMTVRSYDAGENAELKIPDNPVLAQQNQALETVALARTWSAPLLLGPTDALAVIGDNEEANTVELLVLELLDEGLYTYVKAILAACACDEQPIQVLTVEETTTLDPWAGRLFVLVDMEEAGEVVTFPLVASMAAPAVAHVIRVGGEWASLRANVGDSLNGVTAGSIELAGFGGTDVSLASDQWLADAYTEHAVVDLTAAQGDVNLPDLAAYVKSVQVETDDLTSLVTPPVDDTPVNAELRVQRMATDAGHQIVVKPTTGERLNGIVNAQLALGHNDAALVVKHLSGLMAFATSRMEDAVQTTAVNVVVRAWGKRTLILRIVSATARTVTLPPRSAVLAGSRLVVFSNGNTHTLAADGADTIVGLGVAAAANITIATNVKRELVAGDAGEWLVS